MQREDQALAAPSHHGATEGPLLFNSSRGAPQATSLQPQSLFRQPARVYYTLVSAFPLRGPPPDAPFWEQQALQPESCLDTQTRNKRYSISTIASNCETIFTPLARSRDKANETRNDSSRRTQETTTPLARESVSQLSEAWDGCRIVPALRVENRFWQKEVSRAEVAVWVLSMIRSFRIYTNRFNAH